MIAIVVMSVIIVIVAIMFLLSVLHSIEYNNSSWTRGNFCNECDAIIGPYDRVCWRCGNGSGRVNVASWTNTRTYRKRMFHKIEFKGLTK